MKKLQVKNDCSTTCNHYEARPFPLTGDDVVIAGGHLRDSDFNRASRNQETLCERVLYIQVSC